jgi:hypothetical protein
MLTLISETGWTAIAAVGQSAALVGIVWAIAWVKRGSGPEED